MGGAAKIGDMFDCGDFVAAGAATVFVNGMPVARKGDPTTGHGCWPPSMIVDSASSVFAENIEIAIEGNKNIIHCCLVACHQGSLSVVSTDVMVE